MIISVDTGDYVYLKNPLINDGLRMSVEDTRINDENEQEIRCTHFENGIEQTSWFNVKDISRIEKIEGGFLN